MNVVVSAIVDPWVTTFSFVVALAMRIQEYLKVKIQLLGYFPAVLYVSETSCMDHSKS